MACGWSHFVLPVSSVRSRIHATGIKLLEYEGGVSYHGKSIVVDDDLSIVGSFNMDMRSVYLDTDPPDTGTIAGACAVVESSRVFEVPDFIKISFHLVERA